MRIHYYHTGLFAPFNAGALRTANMALALAKSGHDVAIFSGDHNQDQLSAAVAQYELPDHIPVWAAGPGPFPRPFDRVPRRINPFSRHCQAAGQVPDIVILFGVTPLSLPRARRRAARAGVPLIVDADEWMGPGDFTVRSWFTLFPFLYERMMRGLPRQANFFFAISEPMREYVAKAGAIALVVPPLHRPISDGSALKVRDRKPHLVVPGVRKSGRGKERASLKGLRDALASQPSLGDSFVIDVVGAVEEKGSQRLARELGALADVRVHGQVTWARSRQIVAEADWLVALRDPSVRRIRYSFPSKVTESLVLGTPVIANDYSDMRRRLADGDLGILVEDLSSDAVAGALARALDPARRPFDVAITAGQLYTPGAFAGPLDEFLQRVREAFASGLHEKHDTADRVGNGGGMTSGHE